MQQANKRLKATKESTIGDIASYMDDVAETLCTIGQTHKQLIINNNFLVKHILAIKEKEDTIVTKSQTINPNSEVVEEEKEAEEDSHSSQCKMLNRRSRRHRVRYMNEFKSNINTSFENRLSLENTPVNDIITSSSRSRSSLKIDSHGNCIEESNLTLELHDDKVSALFKLENIKSTNVEEIKEKISQINLEGKSREDFLKKEEDKEISGFENDALGPSIKYIEATGEILFSRKSRRQSDWSDRKVIWSNSTQTWRKPCKLQIAYSSQQISYQQLLSQNNNIAELEDSSNSMESPQKLLSLEQITDLSNHLVPNVDDFGGYFRNINLAKEEDIFFKNLNEFLSKNEAQKLDLIPRYINGQLVFQKMNSDEHEQSQNSFVFKHLIHLIIYEGRSKCRKNLSQKFV